MLADEKLATHLHFPPVPENPLVPAGSDMPERRVSLHYQVSRIWKRQVAIVVANRSIGSAVGRR